MKEIYKKVYKGLQPKDLKGGVQVLGMHGMGGIGKTTACKVLCNNLSTDYRVCHAELGSLSETELLRKVLKAFSNLDVELLNGISNLEVVYILFFIIFSL
jgi:Holliday junction resolvasome RuvABC ATP-dependent DNA helicase subunit